MVTVKLKTNIQLMPVPIIIKMMENEFKFNEGGVYISCLKSLDVLLP